MARWPPRQIPPLNFLVHITLTESAPWKMDLDKYTCNFTMKKLSFLNDAILHGSVFVSLIKFQNDRWRGKGREMHIRLPMIKLVSFEVFAT